ncbi:MAG: hypothetical protein INQ03_09035 [Candidatus Heimdallarchaeota archaeon]|nr:hypothetical protein [Candidatus Heimdallarchaeota archaeon]
MNIISKFNQGLICISKQDFDQAIDYFTECVNEEPELVIAHMHLVDSYWTRGIIMEKHLNVLFEYIPLERINTKYIEMKIKCLEDRGDDELIDYLRSFLRR